MILHGLDAQAVLFDCDGILVDSEPVSFLAWSRTLAAHGYTLDEAPRALDDLHHGRGEKLADITHPAGHRGGLAAEARPPPLPGSSGSGRSLSDAPGSQSTGETT